MRRREQHRQRRDDREQGEYNKAQSVYHHRCEFPVSSDVRGHVVLPQLIGDKPDLLQDHRQLVIGTAQTRVARDERLVQPAPVPVVLVRPENQTFTDEKPFAETKTRGRHPSEGLSLLRMKAANRPVNVPEESRRGQGGWRAAPSVVVPEVVVDVEHVRQQALRGAFLQLDVLELQRLPLRGHRARPRRGLAVLEVAGLVLGAVHAEYARQPVQEHDFDLKGGLGEFPARAARGRCTQAAISWVSALRWW